MRRDAGELETSCSRTATIPGLSPSNSASGIFMAEYLSRPDCSMPVIFHHHRSIQSGRFIATSYFFMHSDLAPALRSWIASRPKIK